VTGGKRLGPEHVQRGTPDPAFPEGDPEGRPLIDHRSPAHVDEHAARLHGPESSRVDQAPVLSVSGSATRTSSDRVMSREDPGPAPGRRRYAAARTSFLVGLRSLAWNRIAPFLLELQELQAAAW
jgi:hypothetical protein